MITAGVGTLVGVGIIHGYGMQVGTAGAGMLGILVGVGTLAGVGITGAGIDLGDTAWAGTTGAGAGMLAGAGTTGVGTTGAGIMDGTTAIITTMLSTITDVITETLLLKILGITEDVLI